VKFRNKAINEIKSQQKSARGDKPQ